MGGNLQILGNRPFGFLGNLVVVVPATQSRKQERSHKMTSEVAKLIKEYL